MKVHVQQRLLESAQLRTQAPVRLLEKKISGYFFYLTFGVSFFPNSFLMGRPAAAMGLKVKVRPMELSFSVPFSGSPFIMFESLESVSTHCRAIT